MSVRKRVSKKTGESFIDSGGCTVILGEILGSAGSMNIDEFSMKYLFGPLGIDSSLWFQQANSSI